MRHVTPFIMVPSKAVAVAVCYKSLKNIIPRPRQGMAASNY